MSPVAKALWYIEGHLRLDISLADIAASAGVSRHHLLRAFAAATGMSVLRYVRGRRLSEAAQRLAGGAGDPRFEDLDVLLVAGLNRRYAGLEDSAGVPGQWQQFDAEQSQIRGRIGATAYGVCFNVDDEGSMDYLCGIEVAGFGSQGSQFAKRR